MRCDQYASVFTKEYLMGPNSMVLLEELLAGENLSGMRVMDLGCGQGVSSLYLAKETDASSVISADLWIDATRLQQNFSAWGIAERVFPVHADANALPFGSACFDAIVSVDSYHYFGLKPGFFAEKIWPLVKPGGKVFICVPGLKEEFDSGYPPIMTEWAGDEASCFHSASWWKNLFETDIGETGAVRAFESAHFDRAWADWFESGHQYALQDRAFFEKGLAQHLSFVSIIAEKTI